ncbi:uncharacterized protein LOC111131736 isoform X1 [Crassostrea virginica]|uniref:Uncharacterized protein LOC111131754 isoform X1 n=1 Tax=Crassostrea virginica TaxID=6565 RepID=A0A8B8E4L2_CRAVI|nr:uncharacterized protein LOC111131754 isoform X1 [Crassostrea virginica]
MCASLSNKILILGCIFLATGFTSALIGIMTSVWAVKEDSDDHGFSKFVSYGLWRFRRCGGFRFNEECTKGRLVRAEIEQFGAEGWFRLTQAVACLGLICMVVALLILLLYFFVSSCKQRKALYAIILFTFLSVLFIVIGIAVFGGKMEQMGYSVGWSMGLAIAGVVLAFFAGIMEVLELR